MFWKKKQEKTRVENWAGLPAGASFRRQIWLIFKRNRLAMWSLRVIFGLALIALLADFLANDKPLYCQLDGQTYFPVARQYAVDLGFGNWEARFVNQDWKDQSFERVIWPPIPYAYHSKDSRNRNFKPPLTIQQTPAGRFYHWLGTDRIGRDVLAGMVHGTRIAMLVGLVAMSIALLIGVFLGAMAGYFGDHGLRTTWTRILMNFIGLGLGFFYGFTVRAYVLGEGNWLLEIGKGLLIAILILGLFNAAALWLERIPALGKKFYFPADLLIMRLVETINSIPALLLVLAIVAVATRPSIFIVMGVIGLIRWTTIARFTRAEFLRIRNMEYIQAARIMGLGPWQIIWRHALPNALTPILITLAFGIAGAILLEAFLSFLGVGMSAENVTWGSMLNLARGKSEAWWLAVFPGLAIFITVTVFNLVGEGLTEAIDGRGGER